MSTGVGASTGWGQRWRQWRWRLERGRRWCWREEGGAWRRNWARRWRRRQHQHSYIALVPRSKVDRRTHRRPAPVFEASVPGIPGGRDDPEGVCRRIERAHAVLGGGREKHHRASQHSAIVLEIAECSVAGGGDRPERVRGRVQRPDIILVRRCEVHRHANRHRT
eukprot:1231391-Prymnesium_polylepis.3